MKGISFAGLDVPAVSVSVCDRDAEEGHDPGVEQDRPSASAPGGGLDTLLPQQVSRVASSAVHVVPRLQPARQDRGQGG